MTLDVTPTGWSPAKLAAWNELMAAVEQYESFAQAVKTMGVTDPKILELGTDLGNLITGVLVPAVLATS